MALCWLGTGMRHCGKCFPSWCLSAVQLLLDAVTALVRWKMLLVSARTQKKFVVLVKGLALCQASQDLVAKLKRHP